jgi:C4-dicarboxylate transporter DctM subunit
MTETRNRKLPLLIVVGLIVFLPFLGKGGILAAALLAAALLGAPLFVLMGTATFGSLFLWSGFRELVQYTIAIEGIRSLADSPTLLAIPFFIMSGAVMSRGQISHRLIDFAQALFGWLPGGMAMSAVFACMLFAAISGSSPATVVAIGAMMAPALIAAGYQERFSHGLLTSAGSLGILIPPSIPMIVYPIVNQGAVIEVERLFASGFGPGIVMGSILIGYSFYHGLTKDKVPTQPFRFKKLVAATRDGFWALLFPIFILGGIYGGLFNAVEASALSVVYAIVVEVWLHRALKIKALPSVIGETGIFLGSFLVIMVMALALGEFLEKQEVPLQMVEWIKGMDLGHWQFLVMLNVLLFIVGMLMDILSAMFIFVPLLAPVAMSMGVDPMHFGIIFIVNLEIGYLTPPVGLNLFVASALWEKPLEHIMRSVAPFVGLMLIGLVIVTYYPPISIGLANIIMGSAPETMEEGEEGEEAEEGEEGVEEERPAGGMPTMEEMMREAQADEESMEEEDAPEEPEEQAPEEDAPEE